MRKEISACHFYHVYPLGLTEAPERNDFSSPPVSRILQLLDWIGHWKELGINALYLGPVFESTLHGYDTADFFTVDRRLGTNEDLKTVARELKSAGIRLVLDGVFHHVGRDFTPFRELLRAARGGTGESSPYREWFSGVDFSRKSPAGDPFWYDGWRGHYELVKLNQNHSGVREHIAEAIRFWIREWDIDGLRLDVADCLEPSFIDFLAETCRREKPDFWLLGEVIHGDYRKWARPDGLDSVTNYEMYKSLWSGFNDGNLFETAYALNRQSGPGGIYRGLQLYNFNDNHDVNRIASTLKNREQIYPLTILTWTIPGLPSVYYGSEFFWPGRRDSHSDRALRPALTLQQLRAENREPGLLPVIKKLSVLRSGSPALREGDYQELLVAPKTLAFRRSHGSETIVVAVSAKPLGDPPEIITLPWPEYGQQGFDILNNEPVYRSGENLAFPLYPNWGRIIRFERSAESNRSVI